jgi:RimJ/RimL family protein N-acetyltransferase
VQNPTDGIGATVAAGPGGPGNGAPMQAPPVKPKKKKGALVALLIIPVVAVIALFVLIVGILVAIKPIKYSMADSKLAEKDYDGAITAFTDLGDYKDSAEKIKEAKYLKAEELAKADNYDEAIALYEEYWGLGIGTAMIEYLSELAAGIGWEQLDLEVVADNERGIALYKKCGFVESGRRHNALRFDDGTFHDEILMYKKLN